MTVTTVTVPELTTGTVGETMTAGVITCLPETPLSIVARMMTSYRVHAIVVFGHDDDLAPWGVVSDMDLVAALGCHATAGAIAGSPIVTTTPDDTLLRAVQLMREHATTHLLVVASDTRLPIGVLSTLDIARAFATEQGPTENYG